MQGLRSQCSWMQDQDQIVRRERRKNKKKGLKGELRCSWMQCGCTKCVRGSDVTVCRVLRRGGRKGNADYTWSRGVGGKARGGVVCEQVSKCQRGLNPKKCIKTVTGKQKKEKEKKRSKSTIFKARDTFLVIVDVQGMINAGSRLSKAGRGIVGELRCYIPESVY